MTRGIDWSAPPLSLEDERLLAAYRESGRTLDDLPYTPEFERVVEGVGLDPASRTDCHAVFMRLLRLRKQGRLPRAYALIS